MPPLRLTLLVPGALDARTGGTRYDVQLAAALGRLGVTCRPVALAGAFPGPDAAGTAALATALAEFPSDGIAVVDGLCLATLAELPTAPRFVALMHHPADRETGLPAESVAALRERETQALSRASRVIATSAHTAALLARDYAVARERLGVVPPGVSVTVGPGVRAPRPALPLRVLAVGAVTPRKGYDILVAALALMRAAGVDVAGLRVDCYGSVDRDRTCAAALRRSIVEHDLEGIVHLRGEVDETVLARAYGGADLFVHPARYEGYGMAVADALAAGLPVVAAAGGAVADLVPRNAGLLVPPDDAPAFAGALARAVGDTILRVGLAQGARNAGRALPDWSDAAQRFVAECRVVLT